MVLIPYQQHIGSSGFLIWTANVKKPVITKYFGLKGVLTQKYKLGQVIDITKPPAIAKEIKIFADQDKPKGITDAEKMTPFVNKRFPEAFSWKSVEEIIQVVQPD